MFSMSFPAFFGGLVVPSGLGVSASGHSHKSLRLAVDLNKDIDFLSKHKNDRIFPGFKPWVTFDFSRTQISKDWLAQNPFRKHRDSRKPKKPKNAVEFVKFKYKELKCTSSMFKNIDFSNEAKVTEQLLKKGNVVSNIQLYSVEEKDKFEDNPEGCLAVWWDKKTYVGKKWNGGFKLLWTLKDSNKGIILFLDIQTRSGSMYADAVAYKLELNKNKWKIKGKERKEATKFTKDDENKFFIKPGERLKRSVGNEYWGFGSLDYDNICSSGNACKNLVSESKGEYMWKFNKEGCDEGNNNGLIYNWSKDRSTWVNNLFPSNNLNQYSKVKGCF